MQFFGHGRLISYIQNLWVLMLHADIRHCLNITFAINVDINSKGHIIFYLKTAIYITFKTICNDTTKYYQSF